MSETINREYVPTEDEPFMNERQRDYFRAKLHTWKDEILKEARDTLQHLQDENQNHPDLADFGGPVFGSITNQETSANSNYNSLQVTVSKRFSDGFYFQNAYTWSHCIDNASGLRSNTRFNNTRADRGNCDQDIRQRNVLSYIYELPFFRQQNDLVGKLLGGWQASGIITYNSGLPFTTVPPRWAWISGTAARAGGAAAARSRAPRR